jgi:hypothetical protein
MLSTYPLILPCNRNQRPPPLYSIPHLRGSAATELDGNASPATNDVFPGTTTDDKDVELKARASTHANSESLSNEIDERDLQYEQHSEQRIWT